MHLAAGLACLALLAGCGRAGEATDQATLSFPPDIAEGFAALPRVRLDTPQARAINASLDQMDRNFSLSRAECLTSKAYNDNVSVERSISAPMAGPRFITILSTTWQYCGGAHGESAQTPLVLDLETGRPIDWKAWLPADMGTARIDDASVARMSPAYLKSPTLQAWFSTLALQKMDEAGRADCGALYSEDGREGWGLILWPDAKSGGLTFQTEGLAYAETACQTVVTMPIAELRRRGVGGKLIDAIDAAHRQGRWRDFPPESTVAP